MIRSSRSVSVITARTATSAQPIAIECPVVLEVEVGGREEQADGELDQRIGGGNPGAAVAATAAQDQPGDDRDVVALGDLRLALGASRARSDDRLADRDPMGDDAQKAPDDQAEEPEEDCDACHEGVNLSGSGQTERAGSKARPSACRLSGPGPRARKVAATALPRGAAGARHRRRCSHGWWSRSRAGSIAERVASARLHRDGVRVGAGSRDGQRRAVERRLDGIAASARPWRRTTGCRCSASQQRSERYAAAALALASSALSR